MKEHDSEIESKTRQLEELRKEFKNVFDEKPSKRYEHFKHEIETPNGRKVNVDYRKVSQEMEAGV